MRLAGSARHVHGEGEGLGQHHPDLGEAAFLLRLVLFLLLHGLDGRIGLGGLLELAHDEHPQPGHDDQVGHDHPGDDGDLLIERLLGAVLDGPLLVAVLFGLLFRLRFFFSHAGSNRPFAVRSRTRADASLVLDDPAHHLGHGILDHDPLVVAEHQGRVGMRLDGFDMVRIDHDGFAVELRDFDHGRGFPVPILP
jgi:hypothetical protein